MIVSEKGTNASCPLPSEGIVLLGGKVEEERIHGESVVEMPFVLGRRRRRVRIVNIAAALISLAKWPWPVLSQILPTSTFASSETEDMA